MNTHHASLADLLDDLTTPGELGERREDGAVRCLACAHRCLIREGRRGICQVRFNRGGVLYVPHGYAAGIQADPIEKKPFYHVMPGSDALTFGMLGCDMHCDYCFEAETIVITDSGPISLRSLYELANSYKTTDNAEIGYIENKTVISGIGNIRPVMAIFRHKYVGKLTVVRPYYLPEIHCTPEHRMFATVDVQQPPGFVHAKDLTDKHWLVVPKLCSFSLDQSIDVKREIGGMTTVYKIPWKYGIQDLERMKQLAMQGLSSREIGVLFNTSGSNIRHIRRRLAQRPEIDLRTARPVVENDRLRFPNERRPGIALRFPLSVKTARLLGLYCAEGCVVSSRDRPNSHVINFSFSPEERHLAEETSLLLRSQFGVNSRLVRRPTTLGVTISKASLALLFKALAGGSSTEKRVPAQLFHAPRPVVQAFVEGYVEGDGHRYENGKVTVTTVSRDMAYGIAWLALKLGFLPSLYTKDRPEYGLIENRVVHQALKQYTVVWYENSIVRRKVIELDDCYLVPVRGIEQREHDGWVYNLEVAEDHSYLANFVHVSNCQNWLTSQTLRDHAAGIEPQRVSAAQIVSTAVRAGARAVVSSYNEPLITAEWGVEVFRRAREHELICGFVSNGNATPEVLDYLRPWAQIYKIDLKTMQDRNYRQLGATLPHILDGIRMVHERGFWLEIVTLLVPGFNNSPAELRDLTGFIAALSPEIPWHVTAFYPTYQMTDPPATTVRDLLAAAAIGKEAGLQFVYAGNLPGRVGEFENTYCPFCRHLLIARAGYTIRRNEITAAGLCPACAARIPGIW